MPPKPPVEQYEQTEQKEQKEQKETGVGTGVDTGRATGSCMKVGTDSFLLLRSDGGSGLSIT